MAVQTVTIPLADYERLLVSDQVAKSADFWLNQIKSYAALEEAEKTTSMCSDFQVELAMIHGYCKASDPQGQHD